jgi:homoserine O-acetyltransferase/O-succinyltransferase
MAESPKVWKVTRPFHLECGTTLPEIEIAYHTYGELSSDGDNVVWVCHALTGNAEAADWWDGLVGSGKLFDPAQYFIVCANMLGSCYGSTGPGTINPATQKPYGNNFPLVSIRDMVAAHELLRQQLGIDKIHVALGGSMGGQQVLEWAILQPQLFDNLVLLATNAQHSPWGIAFNESQRMAIYADNTLLEEGNSEAGKKGLETARSIAMLSYRSYDTYQLSQTDADDKLDDFRASSYQRYQGLKLWKRFNVFSYLTLSRAMDSHNIGRGRDGVENALRAIRANTLVIGIESDLLFPIREQERIAKGIENAKYTVLESIYGHDGFLVEFQRIDSIIRRFLFSPEAKVDASPRPSQAWNVSNVALPGSEKF